MNHTSGDDIFYIIKQDIFAILKSIYIHANINIENFVVEKPKNPTHGDFACNAAMVLSKVLQENPQAIASKLIPKIQELPYVSESNLANPAFINIKIKQYLWYEFLTKSISSPNYGFKNVGLNTPINLEFVSANPTGPIHIGHTRAAVYGDTLANLLTKMGYNVTKEYYINDAGSQVTTLTTSVFTRYKQLKGIDIQIPQGCYPGEYLIPIAQELLQRHGTDLDENNPEHLAIVKNFTLEQIMLSIKHDLKRLGIIHDIYTSEQHIIDQNLVQEAVTILENKGLIYKGMPPEPKGKKDESYEPREQTLFKSTLYGDTEDRAIKKSDNTYTYMTSDIAYHKNKLDRGFNKMILILGADHLGYVSRITAATKAVAKDEAKVDLKIQISQIVNFLDDGVPVKMSKRKGTFTTLADVLDILPMESIRFFMLTKKNDLPLDFDLTHTTQHNKDNPIFYIQYASARIHSVLRKPEAKEIDASSTTNFSLLTHTAELNVIKKVLEYPNILHIATKNLEPHHIAFYLYDLAALFHTLWAHGNDNPELKFIITQNPQLTKTRLSLLNACLTVIQSGLNIFGINVIEEM